MRNRTRFFVGLVLVAVFFTGLSWAAVRERIDPVNSLINIQNQAASVQNNFFIYQNAPAAEMSFQTFDFLTNNKYNSVSMNQPGVQPVFLPQLTYNLPVNLSPGYALVSRSEPARQPFFQSSDQPIEASVIFLPTQTESAVVIERINGFFEDAKNEVSRQKEWSIQQEGVPPLISTPLSPLKK